MQSTCTGLITMPSGTFSLPRGLNGGNLRRMIAREGEETGGGDAPGRETGIPFTHTQGSDGGMVRRYTAGRRGDPTCPASSPPLPTSLSPRVSPPPSHAYIPILPPSNRPPPDPGPRSISPQPAFLPKLDTKHFRPHRKGVSVLRDERRHPARGQSIRVVPEPPQGVVLSRQRLGQTSCSNAR